MADYIDKNILCQAYVHVEIPAESDIDLSTLKEHLQEFASLRAKFFVYPDVDVSVEFKEGSVKSYITIAGVIYAAVCGYGSFRSGIDCLHTDIKRLSEALVAESLFMTRARHQNIVRTEARTGVVGSLKLLIDDIELVESSLGAISVAEVARRLGKIKENAESLMLNVRDNRDIGEIESEMVRFCEKLPNTCPHPTNQRPDDEAAIAYHDILAALRKSFKKRHPTQSSAATSA